MQIKAGLKKEYLFFSRSFRMFGVIIAILAFSITDPIMMRMLAVLGQAMDGMSAIESALGVSLTAGYGLSMALSDMLSSSLLIVMLVLMGTAGGEQKKRSTIMPNTAGLTPNSYIIPKFLLYPLFSFAAIFLGTMIAAGISVLCFGGSIAIDNVILAAFCGGVYFAFMLTVQMMVGISTAKPAITVVLIYIATSIIPAILTAFRVDRFNPFSLKSMGISAVASGELSYMSGAGFSAADLIISVVVTAAISVVLYFMTLLVLNSRKIDNSGNEAVL